MANSDIAPSDPDLVLLFGTGSNSRASLGSGWSTPEPGFTWTTGRESELSLPPVPAVDHLLEIETVPFTHAALLPAQRLTVSVNGTVIGRSTLWRPAALAYRVPAELLAERDMLRIAFHHPDAARPLDVQASQDTRPLAIRFNALRLGRADDRLVANPAVRAPVPLLAELQKLSDASGQSAAIDAVAQAELARLTGRPVAQFVTGFESLGDNCEFGLVQRRSGAEPLSLLRFAGSQLHHMHRGLRNGFSGIDAADKINLHLAGEKRREFMVRQLTYDLIYHSFVFEGDATVDEVRAREATKLAFLQRKFLEDVKDGRKIFVVKRTQGLTEDEVLPIFLALNRHAANTLLWVTEADAAHPAGTVERLYDRLLKGYVDRFAPGEEAADLAYPTWLSICANARALAQEDPASAA